MREHLWSTGLLYSKVVDGKETEGANFRDWFDFNEPLRTLPSHRILALLRGRQQGVLELRLGLEAELEAQTPHPAWRASPTSSSWAVACSRWTPRRAPAGWARYAAGPGASSCSRPLKASSSAACARAAKPRRSACSRPT